MSQKPKAATEGYGNSRSEEDWILHSLTHTLYNSAHLRALCGYSRTLLGVLLVVAFSVAEEKAGPQQIVATVNNEPVSAGELEREVALALRGQKLAGKALAELRKQALEQVIDRRLVLRYLEANKQVASQEDVDFALARLVRQLKAKETKLEGHLKSIGMTEKELRQELLWKISWARYVDARVTDENLQKYFDKHRREFDGTELKVAHILLAVPAGESQRLAAALKQAAAIREEIAGGKTSFPAAAKQHSQAPTAKEGGNIGGIRRREPMPEEFSQAAFALQKGDISQPVVTAFGVHLIQVLDVIPGKLTWEDCRGELRPAVTLYLFRWIADRERKTAKITY